jgi:glycosyltransferase involved in cell wall biosynthesis
MPDQPLVSIVIPVRNGADLIQNCLDSVFAQDYPHFEVIVVDNDSTDRTTNIVSEFPVKLVIETNPGAYLARNSGIKHAQGEIIAFTDADCTLQINWLTEIVNCFTEKGIGGVGGNLLPLKPIGQVAEFLSFGKLRLYHSLGKSVVKPDNNCFLSGALGSANMAFRRSVLEELNNFDPELSYFGGDYDLSWRLQKLGFKLIYHPEALVYHQMRGTVKSMIHQFYYFGKGMPLLLKKQPGNFSYLQIKPYILPVTECRLKLPVQILVTLDSLYLFPIFLIISFFISGLFIIPVTLGGVGFLGALGASIKIVKDTGKLKWLFLFPYYHLCRIGAFSAGKFIGGIKYGVFST